MVSAITIEEQAAIIRNNSPNDKWFANNVNIWIAENIKYSASDSMNVNSTDITWENRVGDCSEIALLGERMMKPYIDVHVVSGWMPGGVNGYRHDTVRLHYDKYIRYMDGVENLDFIEYNDGLDPSERIITQI
jgi:hypothetical protein